MEANNLTGADAGALRDKTAKEQDAFADEYYESIRNRRVPTDIEKIAKNAGWAEADITLVRNHIFVDIHDLGDGDIDRFDSDWEIAQAWQRLERNEGTELDILLLNHELLELTIMKERACDYHTAHDEADKTYNWKAAKQKKQGG